MQLLTLNHTTLGYNAEANKRTKRLLSVTLMDLGICYPSVGLLP